MVQIADRTTKVTLVANVSGYLNGMDQAARKTRELAAGAETAKQKLAAQKAALADQQQAFNTIGRSALAFGAVAAAGVALAISKFADFDAAMSSVKASTQESAGNMALLRDAAIEAGGSTVFTATEAAGAIEELGKAGLTTKEILNGGLNGALDLAAAGGIGVAEAASTAAVAMKQFNLEGSDLPHVADLLAAGAGKAVGDVHDLSMALGQAGLVANGAGQSIEDTTGVLAAFADAGLLGSDAGTSLKSAIIALQAPTEKSKDVMEKYGLSFYDANGSMLSFSEIAGQLESKMGNLTDEQRNSALATIFGNDALRAANVLFDEGAVGIQGYIDRTNDSGFAAKVAADRLNNLSGDVEKLGGAFDTALIKSGSAANDVLRGLVQSTTFLVDSIADLPEPVLGTGVALGSVVSAVGLVGGGALLAIPKLAEFKGALDTLEISGKKAALGIGAASAGIAAATLLIGTQISVMAESAGRVDAFADSLDQATGKITDYTRELAVTRLEEAGAYDAAEKMGIGFDLVTDAALGNADAVSELNTRSSEWRTQHGTSIVDLVNGNAFAFDTLRQSVKGTSDELGSSKEQWSTMKQALADTASEQRAAEEAAYAHSEGLADLQGAASDADGQIDTLADTIRGFGDVAISAEEASMAFEAAIDDAKDAVRENGQELDKGTDKGRANRRALLDIAEAAKESSAATLDRTGSEEKARAKIEQGREALIKAATQMGMSESAAKKYADQLGLIPKSVTTAAKVTGIDAAEYALQHLTRPRQTYIQAITTGASGTGANRVSENGNLFENHSPLAFANGGFAPNLGSGMFSAGSSPLYQFAEPGTRWEAYISGKPGQERRNYEIWAEAGKRLGVGAGGGASTSVDQSVSISGNFGYDPVALAAEVQRERRKAIALSGVTGRVGVA